MSELLTAGLPIALLGLLLVPVIVLGTLRSRFPLSRGRRLLSTATRAAAVALVVLAGADLRLGLPTDRLAVGVVVDGSGSIARSEQDTLSHELTRLRGADTSTHWVDVPPVGAAALQGDLAGRVELAVAALPRDRVRRLLLSTDGRDPGELGQALASAHSAGVGVMLLAAGDAPPIDALAVRDLDVPRLVRAGETLDVSVELFASLPVETDLEILVDGERAAIQTTSAAAGPSAHRLPVTFPEDEGVHALSVVARTPGDLLADNDRHETLVRVLSRPRVLLLHPADAAAPLPLATVLRDAQLEVDARPVSASPSTLAELDPFGVVFVDEAKLEDLDEAQQQALRTYVEELGGGLVTITGTNAIRRTPELLREIEPVRPPPAIPEPRPLELVLVIDRSSSMEGRPIAQARAAGIAAVRALREDALCGTVAFSSGADRVMAPVPHDRFPEVQAYISRYVASGGTNIASALAAAGAIISNDERYIRHIILLSDGESDPAPAIAQAHAIAARGVSISAITLGPYSDLMAQIAAAGRGRYHVARNPGSLPALFVREAQFRQPPAHRQVAFRPRVEQDHRMIEGVDFGAGPPLLGHALAAIRPGADTVLAASDGGPLLGHWHVGLGQVATFASATTGGWANEWRAWPGFRALWPKVAWGVMRSRTVDPLEVRVEPSRDGAAVRRITVVGPTLRQAPVPLVQVHREAGGAEGSAVELTASGPGIWRADVPLGEGFLVTARMPGDHEPTSARAADAPYPRELSAFGPDHAALARLADLGGGRILATPAEVLADVDPETVRRSLRIPLLVSALLLYLLGVLLLRLPDGKVGALVPTPVKRAARPPRGTLGRGSASAAAPGEGPDRREEAA